MSATMQSNSNGSYASRSPNNAQHIYSKACNAELERERLTHSVVILNHSQTGRITGR